MGLSGNYEAPASLGAKPGMAAGGTSASAVDKQRRVRIGDARLRAAGPSDLDQAASKRWRTELVSELKTELEAKQRG